MSAYEDLKREYNILLASRQIYILENANLHAENHRLKNELADCKLAIQIYERRLREIKPIQPTLFDTGEEQP